jgi:4a-hydroxytetrahydrobiopterin dehydratase
MNILGWKLKKGKLEKVFTFTDFNAAISFVNQIALIAEKAQHHPDIQLYDYKYVRIILITHSAGRVTDKDKGIARKIDELIGQP